MQRIAISNQKGGVGKTTTTANLGAALSDKGLRVLLIDLDPQAHLSMHFGVEPDDDHPTVYDLLSESADILETIVTVRETISIIPADTSLAAAESQLVGVVGREVILRDALRKVEDQFDVMLIDCPPSLGLLTINALTSVSEVIIPLQAHFFGLQGFSKLLETLTVVKSRINPQLHVGGIILCMYDTGTKLAGEVVTDIEEFLNASNGQGGLCDKTQLYKTRIRRNIKLAESPSFGQSVIDYDPSSNGAIDYQNLALEVINQYFKKKKADKIHSKSAEDVVPKQISQGESLSPSEQSESNNQAEATTSSNGHSDHEQTLHNQDNDPVVMPSSPPESSVNENTVTRTFSLDDEIDASPSAVKMNNIIQSHDVSQISRS